MTQDLDIDLALMPVHNQAPCPACRTIKKCSHVFLVGPEVKIRGAARYDCLCSACQYTGVWIWHTWMPEEIPFRSELERCPACKTFQYLAREPNTKIDWCIHCCLDRHKKICGCNLWDELAISIEVQRVAVQLEDPLLENI